MQYAELGSRTPQDLYRELAADRRLITAEMLPRNEVEAGKLRTTGLEYDTPSFLPAVRKIGDEINNRMATEPGLPESAAIGTLLSETKTRIAEKDWGMTPDSSQPLAATADIFDTYMLTLLSGRRKTFEATAQFMYEQTSRVMQQYGINPSAFERLAAYSQEPWHAPHPLGSAIAPGSERTHAFFAAYSLLAFRGQLLEQQPHAQPLRTITTNLVHRWDHVRSAPQSREVIAKPTPRPQMVTALGEVAASDIDIVREAERLDWQILPPAEIDRVIGTLAKKAEHTKTNRHPIEIDKNRAEILKEIRSQWGEDRSYYMYGQRTKRSSVRDAEDSHLEPNAYIALVLEETDANGEVILRHAVADNPITNNALYIYRQDVAGEDLNGWEILGDPKEYVDKVGIRSLRHRSKDSDTFIVKMATRTLELLSCSAEDFSNIDFVGVNPDGSSKVTRKRRQRLARHTGAAVVSPPDTTEN
jgi:hypothetical protein